MTQHILRTAVPMLLVLLLAGCAGTVAWTRPGTTPEQAAGDLDECSRLAFREASYSRFWHRPFWGYPYAYGRAYPYYYEPGFEFDSAFQEQRLQNFCMRSRGYQLQPVEPQG